MTCNNIIRTWKICAKLCNTSYNKKSEATITSQKLTIQNPVLANISECAVYIKDNERNQRLHRIVSGDNLSETHYLEKKHLRNKWQLVYLSQGNSTDTLEKFNDRVVEKCEDANGEGLYITNAAELGVKLSRLDKRTEVLLCVMEKEKDDQFRKALKREAELERKLMTKSCHMKIVDDNLIAGKEPTVALKHLVLEMVAKTGAYKGKAFFLNSALPTQFRGEVMYLGCHVSYSNPHLTVMVGNTGTSHRCANEYECRVGQGDYNMVGEMFGQLLQKNRGSCSLSKRIVLFREGHARKRVEGNLQEEVNAMKREGGGGDVRVTLLVHQRLSCAIRYETIGFNLNNGSHFLHLYEFTLKS